MMRWLMRAAKKSSRRQLKPRQDRERNGVDRGLLADVEYLAEVVAATIGRLHAARRGDIARPLEDALGRLGRTR